MHRNGVATREYFPRTFVTAVRQRTRWITGIALQTWERHGWRGSLGSKYWMWRDRKALIGNPASLAANLLSAYGFLRWILCSLNGVEWTLGKAIEEHYLLLVATSCLAVYRQVYRAVCTGHVYGVAFALAMPVRSVVANAVNTFATFTAVRRFLAAKRQRQPLRWVKTEHQYPGPLALAGARPLIGEVLVMNGYITEAQLAHALDTLPPQTRIGEHLIALGMLDEESLYEALSLQTGLPQEAVDLRLLSLAVARTLPARIVREWGVVPVRFEPGRLVVIGPEVPTEDLERAIRACTTLEPKFHLTTPSNYRQILETVLPTPDQSLHAR
jgi:adsorption protein B